MKMLATHFPTTSYSIKAEVHMEPCIIQTLRKTEKNTCGRAWLTGATMYAKKEAQNVSLATSDTLFVSASNKKPPEMNAHKSHKSF